MIHLSAYSLIDLHSQNDKKPNKRADNCIVRQVKHKIDKTVIFHVGCHESWSSGMGHIVSVKFNVNIQKYQKEKPLTTDVQVACSCPAFLYWGSEYAATQLGYGLDTDEHRPPEIRDPNNNNLICKHIAKVRKHLRNHTFKQLLNNKDHVPIRHISSTLESLNINPETTTEENFVDQLVEAGVSIK